MSCCVDRRKVVKGLSGLALLGSGMGQRSRKRIKLAFCSQLLCIIPYEVAARRGYFQEEGLEVELVYARGGSQALQFLVGRAVDYAATSLDAALQAYQQGAPILRFASTGRLPLFALASSPKAPGIRGMEDLEGRTVGVSALGNADHVLLVYLLLGGILGLLAAFSPLVADLLEPVMLLLNAIPRVILAPLFVIWLGIGLASKVALSLVLVAVLIFFAVYSGVKQVDPRLVERIRTLGGGRYWLLREVYLPSITAWVLSSLKVAVGFAFTGAVVGEFVAASRGLGYLLSFAQSTYNARLSLALIALIVAFVLLLFFLFNRLEARLLRWRGQTSPTPG